MLFATTGPGILNAATALAQAWSDSSPVLAISPGMPTGHPRRATGRLHEARDQHAALAAVVDRAVRVDTPAAAAEAVRDAFTAFRGSRPRPWHLEIALDRLDDVDEVPDELFVPAAADRPRVDPELARAAAALLAGAERPAVVLGGGARGASAQARALVEALGCPAVTSTNGKGVLPESHPSSLGCGLHLAAVQRWLRAADVVLVVGCELAESDAWTTEPLVTGRVVRIDLDPGQRDLNAPAADVMLVADAAAALAVVTAALAAVRPADRPRPRRGAPGEPQDRGAAGGGHPGRALAAAAARAAGGPPERGGARHRQRDGRLLRGGHVASRSKRPGATCSPPGSAPSASRCRPRSARRSGRRTARWPPSPATAGCSSP